MPPHPIDRAFWTLDYYSYLRAVDRWHGIGCRVVMYGKSPCARIRWHRICSSTVGAEGNRTKLSRSTPSHYVEREGNLHDSQQRIQHLAIAVALKEWT